MVAGDAERGLQVADLLDDDLFGGGLAAGFARRRLALARRLCSRVGGRHDPDQVGVVAGEPPLAGLAVIAGVAVGARRIAQQARGERLGQLALAQSRRPDEEQRVRQTIAELDHALPGRLQPGVDHEKNRSRTMRSISVRIRSGARSASITQMRPGAWRARSR